MLALSRYVLLMMLVMSVLRCSMQWLHYRLQLCRVTQHHSSPASTHILPVLRHRHTICPTLPSHRLMTSSRSRWACPSTTMPAFHNRRRPCRRLMLSLAGTCSVVVTVLQVPLQPVHSIISRSSECRHHAKAAAWVAVDRVDVEQTEA